MRYQFIEAKERVGVDDLLGDVHGFLIAGPKEEAEAELKRILDERPRDLVAISGKKVPASSIDAATIAVRHETEPKGTMPGSGVPRFAIDGTQVDGCEGD